MIFIFFLLLLVVPHSIAIHFIMFTGACTEDEDCKNATIETGNDNCASLRHYPHEEPLRTSSGFSEENAATKESFEDDTQLGNVQDNTESPGICEDSTFLYISGKLPILLIVGERRERKASLSLEHVERHALQTEEMGFRHYPHEEPLRTSLGFSEENAATKESFEDETLLAYFPDDKFQRFQDISPLSAFVKVIYAATKESFEDETQSGNFQHSIIQLVPIISPSSGSVKVILLILERIIMIRNFNQAKEKPLGKFTCSNCIP